MNNQDRNTYVKQKITEALLDLLKCRPVSYPQICLIFHILHY